MKIVVRTEDIDLNIPLPISLIDSFIVRKAIESGIKDEDINVDMLMDFLHIVKKELKKYKGLHLVEVEASDGTYVDIVV